MKSLRNLSVFTLLLTAPVALATAITANRISYNGKIWLLYSEPLWAIGADDNIVSILPADRSISTASRTGGYISCWSIKNGKLELDSCLYHTLNPETFDFLSHSITNEQIHERFKEAGLPDIDITKFSGELRLASGDCIKYVHMGWESRYEDEIFLRIKKGRLLSEKRFHNKKINGINIDSIQKILNQEVAKLNFPARGRIVVSLSHIKLDNKGRISNLKIKIIRRMKAVIEEKEYDKLLKAVRAMLIGLGPVEHTIIYGKSSMPPLILPITIEQTQ